MLVLLVCLLCSSTAQEHCNMTSKITKATKADHEPYIVSQMHKHIHTASLRHHPLSNPCTLARLTQPWETKKNSGEREFMQLGLSNEDGSMENSKSHKDSFEQHYNLWHWMSSAEEKRGAVGFDDYSEREKAWMDCGVSE